MKRVKTGRLLSAAPETNANILYAGGFQAPDEVVWFRADGKEYLAASVLEFARAKAQCRKNVQVLPRELLFDDRSVNRTSAELLLAISRKFEIGCWEVPEDFPVAYADVLRAAGLQLRICTPFFPKRETKRADEIRKLRKSMLVTQDAMMLVREILHQSVIGANRILRYKGKPLTSEILRARVEGFLKEEGYTASGTICSHGEQCALPHHGGTGPILAGETVVADIFPRSDSTGYWGDMTRTFVKGKPLPVVQKAWEAVLEASRTAEKMVRNGVLAASVHEAAAEVMAKAGFRTGHTKNGSPCGFIHGLGHGVGLDIHEAPRMSPSNPDGLLRTGHVVSNEPGLYHPAWGGIRLEDVLVVTGSGNENFYTMRKDLDPDA